MADQERKAARRQKPEEEEEATVNPRVAEKGKELKKGVEKVLEEIDSVLEQNAEEFVKSYVQRGGE
jgi:ubiquitin-like protein Pup